MWAAAARRGRRIGRQACRMELRVDPGLRHLQEALMIQGVDQLLNLLEGVNLRVTLQNALPQPFPQQVVVQQSYRRTQGRVLCGHRFHKVYDAV